MFYSYSVPTYFQNGILYDVMTYLLMLLHDLTYFLMSACTIWHHIKCILHKCWDIFFDIIFDVTTSFLTSWCIFYILYMVMYLLKSWVLIECTYWNHGYFSSSSLPISYAHQTVITIIPHKTLLDRHLLILIFIECFMTTFLHTHFWLNWVDEDDDEVGLKEKPQDIKKST